MHKGCLGKLLDATFVCLMHLDKIYVFCNNLIVQAYIATCL